MIVMYYNPLNLSLYWSKKINEKINGVGRESSSLMIGLREKKVFLKQIGEQSKPLGEFSHIPVSFFRGVCVCFTKAPLETLLGLPCLGTTDMWQMLDLELAWPNHACFSPLFLLCLVLLEPGGSKRRSSCLWGPWAATGNRWDIKRQEFP